MIEIRTGLLPHMVLQRNARGVSDAEFTGACNADGTVEVRVTRGGKTVKGFDWARAGTSAKRRFTARLKGLPAGGPYDVAVRVIARDGTVLDTADVVDVLVGDVWVLGGQSNMHGVGLLADAEPPHPLVRAYQVNDTWIVAQDCIHDMSVANARIHIQLCGGKRPPPNARVGVGPGVSFARRMMDLTGVPQGVISCAHGGTSMDQWDPAKKRLKDASLYGAMIERFRRNGARVAGAVWYQGESDTNPESAPHYGRKMKRMVAAMRKDFADPQLPFAIVQIGRVAGWAQPAQGWNSVQDQQRRLALEVPRLATVPSIDLDLDDLIHISGRDQRRLGRRLAEAMHAVVTPRSRHAAPPPIRLRKVRLESIPGTVQSQITLEYDNVSGSLRAPGRPTGFEVTMGSQAYPCIFRTDVEGDCVRLLCNRLPADLADKHVHYGFGHDPYCNITDAADRSLPVMGPIPIAEPRALTGFAREISVSAFQPAIRSVRELKHPVDLAALELSPRRFDIDFCNMHQEIAARDADALLYFGAKVTCPQAMKVRLWCGYDGPVKVWVSGRERFCDPKGTNPADPADAFVDLSLPAGETPVLIGMGTNGGQAWGVFLRAERLGLSKATLAKGPEHYALPRITPL